MIKLFILGSLFSWCDSTEVATTTNIQSINAYHSQYFPQFNAAQEAIYFTVRKGKGEREDIFLSKIKQGAALPASSIENINIPYFNEGTCTFNETGTTMVFSACDYPNSKGGCDLYESNWVNGQWTSPKNLGFFINSREWDGQPHLFNQGKSLFFASERMGGMGGRDLWLSEKDSNGNWGIPKNLGPKINSKFNEIGPYFIKKRNILVYSSDKKEGKGNLDFYQSIKETDGWSDPKNLEIINTSEDDAGICEGILPNEFFVTESSALQSPSEQIFAKIIPEEIWLKPKEVNIELVKVPALSFTDISFKDIFFENNKWELPSPSPKSIDLLLQFLNENPTIKIQIEGHSDETGNAKYNLSLSEKRANSVKNYLVGKGISPERINCVGFGNQKPKGKDLAANRRIEIKIN